MAPRPLKRKPARRPAVTQPPPRVALYTAAYTRRLTAMLTAWYDHAETFAREALGSRHDAKKPPQNVNAFKVVSKRGTHGSSATREGAEKRISALLNPRGSSPKDRAVLREHFEGIEVITELEHYERIERNPALGSANDREKLARGESIRPARLRPPARPSPGARPVMVPGALEDGLKAAYDVAMRASGLDDFLKRMAGDIHRAQRGYVTRVTKIPPAYTPGRQELLEGFRRTNVDLITKMGEEQRAQIGDILRRAQSDGSRWEDIAPEIQGRLGVGKSRAKLIARDQTNKFNSSAQQATQRDAGISKYRWSTSKDNAVRGRPGGVYAKSKEDHWALEGKVFSWFEPPIIPGTSERAHPGERIQCRCVAVPVVPLFEDA